MSVAYAILLYVASAVFFGGVFFRVLKYWRTPAPLKIPTMPAPVTQAGVVMRMAREVVLFESLFKSSMWTWIFGWMFHVSLLLAFFRHLRYAISPDNILWPLINLELVQAAGKYAGIFMLIGLLGLLARRIFVERVRYISGPSDYLMLILILTIAGTGLSITFLDPTDIVSLKIFVLGLFRFNLQPLPSSLLLQTHLAMVALLMIVFPISKLLHAPGIFFSPTRNQVDDAREKRHLVPWAAKLDATRGHKIEIKG
ncbi:MAG TPA: nitrate reductase [Gammaproteobacteria bacterium]|nr:nitrate reductase [Gammaproteobacteria bacterium]